MHARYVRWVYPRKSTITERDTRGEMPTCFLRKIGHSLTWDTTSANDADRVEYWEVDLAKFESVRTLHDAPLTLEEVELAVYGVEGKAAYVAKWGEKRDLGIPAGEAVPYEVEHAP